MRVTGILRGDGDVGWLVHRLLTAGFGSLPACATLRFHHGIRTRHRRLEQAIGTRRMLPLSIPSFLQQPLHLKKHAMHPPPRYPLPSSPSRQESRSACVGERNLEQAIRSLHDDELVVVSDISKSGVADRARSKKTKLDDDQSDDASGACSSGRPSRSLGPPAIPWLRLIIYVQPILHTSSTRSFNEQMISTVARCSGLHPSVVHYCSFQGLLNIEH